MSQSRYIPLPIRCMLWGISAGRCEFFGCNKLLSRHPKTQESVNLADVAHVIGFSEDGPRGEEELSEELAKDISNLMLLCKECHKTIDDKMENYPVDRLREMKSSHEARVEYSTGAGDARQSHVLLYGANIGQHTSNISYLKAVPAMLPQWYPYENRSITLGMVNSSFRDVAVDFWQVESKHLRTKFEQQIGSRLADGTSSHLSVFALAPQPLLILLGFLISDIPEAEVYQLHREPQDWRWQEHPEGFEYTVQVPERILGAPALVFSLSATVTDDRIRSVLGEKATIWRITHPSPNNDFIKSRRQLQLFRQVMRPLLDRIKSSHGKETFLHVFPAMPVSTAVEFGRITMPKADLPLRIYDENRSLGGFVHALDINNPPLQGGS